MRFKHLSLKFSKLQRSVLHFLHVLVQVDVPNHMYMEHARKYSICHSSHSLPNNWVRQTDDRRNRFRRDLKIASHILSKSRDQVQKVERGNIGRNQLGQRS